MLIAKKKKTKANKKMLFITVHSIFTIAIGFPIDMLAITRTINTAEFPIFLLCVLWFLRPAQQMQWFVKIIQSLKSNDAIV